LDATSNRNRPVVTAAPLHRCSAEDVDRGVFASIPGVVFYPRTMWRHRGLVWNFFRRDLLGRFRGSALGVLWVLVHPVFQFAVYYVVFGFLFGPRLEASATPDPFFPFHLFFGIVAYGAFMEGSSRACTVVVDNGNLVKKVAFPCELLVVHPVLTAMVVYVVGAALVLAIGIPLGHVQPDLRILCWPLVLVVHVALTLGVGLLLANCFVFARDVSHLWGIAAQALMFLSPVFWWIAQIDSLLQGSPGWAAAFRWNPLYPLLHAHRQCLGLGDHPVAAAGGAAPVVPEPLGNNLLLAAAWAAVFLAFGYGAFLSRRPKYADLV
jgi:lipopolysaccharide transport system permease protein